MDIELLNLAGIVLIILIIIGVGIYSGRMVSDASDFDTGGCKAGAWMVCGAIMGSLVSGQATIGTAQLAFEYGMSAWWFTLGSGIGCLILAIGYVIPLRYSGSITLLEVIGKEYGAKAEYTGSVLCSIGIFISMIAQVLSCCALLTAIFHMDFPVAVVLSVIVMTIYVVFGGAWGAGMGGVVKLVLLYASSIFGLGIVLTNSHGIHALLQQLYTNLSGTDLGSLAEIATAKDVSGRYLSLFSRGFLKDMGSGLSVLLGVLATQTYAQAIWSAKSDSKARKGALLSAFLIPPIGIAGIVIGIFMRNHCLTTAEIAALTEAGKSIPKGMMEIAGTSQAFPMFVIHYMPKFIGGVVLGTLLVTVIAGGAGLSLGTATILMNDIFCKLFRSLKDAKKKLYATRVTIVVLLGLAAAIALIVPGAIINDFGFLSMGIRGTVVLLPLTCALFAKGKVASWAVLDSMIAGPLAVLGGNLLKLPFDALFLGLFVCGLLIGIGTFSKKAN